MRIARLALASLTLASCGDAALDRERHAAIPPAAPPAAVECANRDLLRQVLYGDLHVHTALSSDAYQFGVRVMPDGAYAYAFGDPILLPPADASGRGTREVRIDRPLDFAAVTDHAEFLGETDLCTDPESGMYDADLCDAVRAGSGRDFQLAKHIFSPVTWRNRELCGGDGLRCLEAAERPWGQIIRAAETWNDPCRRTTFVAYEYSSHRLGSNLHRNVLFRNAAVPRLPISYLEATREWELWALLRELCIESGTGCDALAIPHNSNLSNGRMFAVDYPGARSVEEQARRAALRAALEPVVEVMQHKGDSECAPGVPGVIGAADELCGFEKFDLRVMEMRGDAEPGACYAGPLADCVPHLGPTCLSRLSYARYALIEGLKEAERLGVNPFKFGLMASTDTHNGMAGGVEERSFPGHLGTADDRATKRVAYDPGNAGNASNGPGGLIGVWAEQNTRDAIFDALRRREVFGTSGPRIPVRFFGGWDYPEALCADPARLQIAYRDGVPMGGDLPPAHTPQAPLFLVSAARDPGMGTAPGGLLQRLQVIKGWVDADGRSHERVIDVAGSPNNGADVDPASCAPRGHGHAQLCTVWRDPDFDPARRAVYYARVVENPSCRYSAWQCLGIPAQERPADCEVTPAQQQIQERAWSSPIWYTPLGA